jgi:DNA-binding PadR family transcriptional regulator
MHGYQLNEFIDSHLGATVHLKKPTAYRLLNGMVDEGWISYTEEQEGNRPPRRVFAITAKGEAVFQRLLRECLADYQPMVFSGNVGLLFLDALPSAEAVGLLQERRASVRDLLQMTQGHAVHGTGSSLLLLHQTRHLETELAWLDEVIARLESGAEGGAES